jgi:hypothetical protein
LSGCTDKLFPAEHVADSGPVQSGSLGDVTKGQTGSPRSLETVAPLHARLFVTVASPFEFGLRAFDIGASRLLRIDGHCLEPIGLHRLRNQAQ